MFDRRERAHSRESGFVATTFLHGPVVIGVPRVGNALAEQLAAGLEVADARVERFGRAAHERELDRRRRAIRKGAVIRARLL